MAMFKEICIGTQLGQALAVLPLLMQKIGATTSSVQRLLVEDDGNLVRIETYPCTPFEPWRDKPRAYEFRFKGKYSIESIRWIDLERDAKWVEIDLDEIDVDHLFLRR